MPRFSSFSLTAFHIRKPHRAREGAFPDQEQDLVKKMNRRKRALRLAMDLENPREDLELIPRRRGGVSRKRTWWSRYLVAKDP